MSHVTYALGSKTGTVGTKISHIPQMCEASNLKFIGTKMLNSSFKNFHDVQTKISHMRNDFNS